MNEKLSDVLDFLKTFIVSLGADYKKTWELYPATLFWTSIIAFSIGLIV